MKENFTNYGGCPGIHYPAKIKRLLQYCIAPLLFLLLCTSAIAQTSSIKGLVLDEQKLPMPGVTIKLKGTANGTVTNVDGQFSINAVLGQTLVFSFLGYSPQEVTIKDLKSITVNLAANATNMNEVVVVGYGTQKKVSLTSAVSSINSTEIVTTKNENVQNMLTGKVAGLRVVQNSSEPGNFDNSFDIRGLGSPLVVIDGIPRDNITRLDPNDIESLSVLKDGAAAIYGVRAANGVVLITTKRGKKGTLELNYSGTYGWQKPSGLPKAVGAIDYMTLANELLMHNVNGGRLGYTAADMAPYRLVHACYPQ
jgi:TonB-dependent SusC/RagA subfamily outer membrane receptor